MSAEGLMGPFALNDPAAGTTGPWYTNGTFGLTAGWHLDIWGKNRAEVTARPGTVKARAAEREQTRQLLAGSVARLYWEWQTQAALNTVLQQIEKSRTPLSRPIASYIRTGLLLQLKVWKPILMPAKPGSSSTMSRGK